jgi:hypothetical protein
MEAIQPDTEFLGTLALSAVREQKLLAPRKTSNLGRSIHVHKVTATTAETIANADYAAYVEFGTGPHTIVPRNRKFLRFPAKGTSTRLTGTARRGGAVVFRKRVQHPGTRAQPYMIPGAKKAVEGANLKARLIDAWNGAA